jgi:hypothetical protein
MAGTRPEIAWPQVEQNAVVAEISLPHFEQYTSSPFHTQTGRWFRKSYLPLLCWSIILALTVSMRPAFTFRRDSLSELLYDFEWSLVQFPRAILQS